MACVSGREVAVGNSRLLASQGVRLDTAQAAEEALWQAKGARLPPFFPSPPAVIMWTGCQTTTPSVSQWREAVDLTTPTGNLAV